jgi:cytochrome c oxidase subunit II
MERFLGFPPNYSAHGAQLDYLTGLVHWLMLVLFVGWGAFFLFTLFRFRKGRNPVASYEGAKSHFSTYGEAAVALIEAVLLVGFAVPIWAKRVGTVPTESQATVVRVVAQQFAWNVQYPGADGVFGRTDPKFINAESNPLGLDPDDPAGKDDIVTLNQLHLPVGKPALVKLTSKDVIHSFFLPYMRVKQDAIPGMMIPIYFTPTTVTPPEAQFPGCAANHTCWEIACAQLCGPSHYRMRGYYSIDSPADYDKWLKDNAPKVAAAPAAAPVAPATPGGAATPASPSTTAPPAASEAKPPAAAEKTTP